MRLKLNLLLALFLVSGSALLVSAIWHLPLDLTLLGLIALGLSLYLAVRFPEWFLVAALFAPQWKTFWIFQSISQRVDLTLAMLLCLAAGLAWRTTLWFGRLGYRQVRAMFSGQLIHILTFLLFAAIVSASYFYTSAPVYGGAKLVRFLLIGTLLFIAPFFIIFTDEDFHHFARIAGLIASAARGAIVALAAAVLIGAAVLLKKGRLRLTTAALLLFFLVAGVGGAFLVLRQTDLGKYNAKAGELTLLFTEGSASGTAARRMDFYRTTLAAIPDHPLFGSGIGSWSKFYFGNDQRNYPHNLFLEITFEEGLLGLTAFLALLILVELSISRMLSASHSYFLVLGLLVFYCLAVSLFSGDLDDNRVLWLWIGVTLTVCRIVQIRVNALYTMQRSMRHPRFGGARIPSAAAFSRRRPTERYSH